MSDRFDFAIFRARYAVRAAYAVDPCGPNPRAAVSALLLDAYRAYTLADLDGETAAEVVISCAAVASENRYRRAS